MQKHFDSASIDAQEVRQLRVFAAVAAAGGLSQAQSILGISLSTISGHLAVLEQRLKCTLCRRGRSGFALTAEGEQVLAEALLLFEAIDRYRGRLGELDGPLRGTLRLCLTDNTISDPSSPLTDVLARFVELAPEVRLITACHPVEQMLQHVLDGSVDIIISGVPVVPHGLRHMELYAEQQLFYAGRRHPLFAVPDAKITTDAIRSHRLVARSYWSRRDLKPFGIEEAHAVVTDMETEARLILSGMFLGHLPEHYAKRWVETGELRVLLRGQLGYRSRFRAVYRKDLRSKAAGLFLAQLQRALKDGQRRF